MENGVAGFHVGEKGIAQALSLRRALNQSGYVDHVQEGWNLAVRERRRLGNVEGMEFLLR